MLKIAICDDEPAFTSLIADIVNRWAGSRIDTDVTVFHDGDALIKAHTASPFDIILLDVIMPLLDGMQTAREIRSSDKNVHIVFLTSSRDFAVESYTIKADNYILKPLDPDRLFMCLDELAEEISSDSPGIIVKSPYAIHRINLHEIEYIEAQNKHILFVLSDGNIIESLTPLYSHEHLLKADEGFFKCHRSYIVNLQYIDTYTTKEIQMRSGVRIPISRSCHKEFEDAYFTALFGKAGESN